MKILIIIALFFVGIANAQDVIRITQQPGKDLKKHVPTEIFDLLESREPCRRLVWFKEKLPRRIRLYNADYSFKRVNRLFSYEDSYIVIYTQHGRGLQKYFVLINSEFEIVSEYILYTTKNRISMSIFNELCTEGKIEDVTIMDK